MSVAAGLPKWSSERRRTTLLDKEWDLSFGVVEAPADWIVHGEVRRHEGGCDGVQYRWEAVAPDRRYAVEGISGASYVSRDYQKGVAFFVIAPCYTFDSPAAERFLASALAPALWPQATVEAAEPAPETLPALVVARAEARLADRDFRQPRGLRINIGRIRTAELDDGRPEQAYVATMTSCDERWTQQQRGGRALALSCIARPIARIRAPVGKLEALDAASPELVRFSENPLWRSCVQRSLMAKPAGRPRRFDDLPESEEQERLERGKIAATAGPDGKQAQNPTGTPACGPS